MKENPANILIVDDNEDTLLAGRVVLRRHFAMICATTDPSSLPDLLVRENYDVVLLDMNFSEGSTDGFEGLHWLREIRRISPSTAVVMMTAYGEINLAVAAMKEGAADFVIKPWDNQHLVSIVLNASRLSATDLQKNGERDYLKEQECGPKGPFSDIIGESPLIKNIFRLISKVGRTDVNVLILGENGTGKELVARALHKASAREGHVFCSVDMGAVSETLFESELFGHTRGSFTDAREERAGRFEMASGGTLFLDEIGNLSLPLQSKLLSALQNREIFRIGSGKAIPIDVRLICATNRPIYEMVKENTFRQDLLYRINTVELHLPPLRERPGDIPLLVNYYVRLFSVKYGKMGINVSRDAIQRLIGYSWPGNVRELQHMIERVIIMTDRQVIEADDFVMDKHGEKEPSMSSFNLEVIERNTIRNALSLYDGNLTKVARELGLGRTTLYRKMSKYGL